MFKLVKYALIAIGIFALMYLFTTGQLQGFFDFVKQQVG